MSPVATPAKPKRAPIRRNNHTIARNVKRYRDYTLTTTERTVYLNERNDKRVPMSVKKRVYKRDLALLIAAHNEELVIEQTILSAINAGMNPRDIYVVDDNSSDATSRIVKRILSDTQVVKVRRSGKGLALTKASRKFNLSKRYRWIHIADADGGFSPDYFNVFRARLNPRFAAATGYVRSLPGGSVSQYRVMEYTMGMELFRRFQSVTQTIPVIPGPTSCFRADVFAKLDFANKTMTEDFDVTLQLYRQKLGKVQFIPEAVAYTQDPKTFHDYTKQITRWYRGMLQGMRRHKIGRRANRIDVYLTYQLLQNLAFIAYVLIFIPAMVIIKHNPELIATLFIWDVSIIFTIALLSALKSRRIDIISAFPQIYVLRWLSAFVFLRAFVEVVILRKFRVSTGVWGTNGRRYKSETDLLSV